jgi:membrane protein
MKGVVTRVGRRFVSDIARDDVGGLAAELAYRFLFAIFPFGIFVAALTAFLAQAVGIEDPTGKIVGALGDNLPKDLAAGIRPQIEAVIGTARPGLLTFGAVAALWAATGGTNALIKAMNRAYEVEETRPFVPKTLLAIGLTLLATIGILVAFVTIVGASLLTTEAARRLNLDQGLVGALGLLRWPFVFVLLSIAVGVLYKLAPNVRVPFRWCLAGGALFSVGWLVATALFGLYVANFANYSNTYGALGGVIVLMLWFYISAFILVAAAALVAAALKETKPHVVAAAKAEAGARTVTQPAKEAHKKEAPKEPNEPKAIDLPPPVPAGAPDPGLALAARAMAAAPSRKRGRETRRRRGGQPVGWQSKPEDWAFAGVVAGIGATVGVLAAWLSEYRTRT